MVILGCSPGCAAISFCECANTKLTYPSCETQDATGEGQGLADLAGPCVPSKEDLWTFLGVQRSVGCRLLHLETGRFLQCLPDSELGDQLSSSISFMQPDLSHTLPLVQRAFLCPLMSSLWMCCGRKWTSSPPSAAPPNLCPKLQHSCRPVLQEAEGVPLNVLASSELTSKAVWMCLGPQALAA